MTRLINFVRIVGVDIPVDVHRIHAFNEARQMLQKRSKYFFSKYLDAQTEEEILKEYNDAIDCAIIDELYKRTNAIMDLNVYNGNFEEYVRNHLRYQSALTERCIRRKELEDEVRIIAGLMMNPCLSENSSVKRCRYLRTPWAVLKFNTKNIREKFSEMNIGENDQDYDYHKLIVYKLFTDDNEEVKEHIWVFKPFNTYELYKIEKEIGKDRFRESYLKIRDMILED